MKLNTYSSAWMNTIIQIAEEISISRGIIIPETRYSQIDVTRWTNQYRDDAVARIKGFAQKDSITVVSSIEIGIILEGTGDEKEAAGVAIAGAQHSIKREIGGFFAQPFEKTEGMKYVKYLGALPHSFWTGASDIGQATLGSGEEVYITWGRNLNHDQQRHAIEIRGQRCVHIHAFDGAAELVIPQAIAEAMVKEIEAAK